MRRNNPSRDREGAVSLYRSLTVAASDARQVMEDVMHTIRFAVAVPILVLVVNLIAYALLVRRLLRGG